jgi:hypothetical protein
MVYYDPGNSDCGPRLKEKYFKENVFSNCFSASNSATARQICSCFISLSTPELHRRLLPDANRCQEATGQLGGFLRSFDAGADDRRGAHLELKAACEPFELNGRLRTNIASPG